jgi:hypothetical protein
LNQQGFIKIRVARNQLIGFCRKHSPTGSKFVIARIEIASCFNGRFTNNCGGSGD